MFDKLFPITDDDSLRVRSVVHTAVRVLAIHSPNDEYADPWVTDAVVRCLEDDEGSVRASAQCALGPKEEKGTLSWSASAGNLSSFLPNWWRRNAFGGNESATEGGGSGGGGGGGERQQDAGA